MVYRIHRSIDISFAHHIRGHRGACINIHGHTWKFEVELEADELDNQGFVIDFSLLSQKVLKPCHQLLDHSLAIGEDTFNDVKADLHNVGQALIASREVVHKEHLPADTTPMSLGSARLEYAGGMKVAVFDFSPTSERLARWLYDLSHSELANDRVRIASARIYETLHPVESVASYSA